MINFKSFKSKYIDLADKEARNETVRKIIGNIKVIVEKFL